MKLLCQTIAEDLPRFTGYCLDRYVSIWHINFNPCGGILAEIRHQGVRAFRPHDFIFLYHAVSPDISFDAIRDSIKITGNQALTRTHLFIFVIPKQPFVLSDLVTLSLFFCTALFLP